MAETCLERHGLKSPEDEAPIKRGLYKRRSFRPAILITAGLLITAAGIIAAVYFWSSHTNLRVTIGAPALRLTGSSKPSPA